MAPRSQDRGDPYQFSEDICNIDEEAISPPVDRRDDKRDRTALEDCISEDAIAGSYENQDAPRPLRMKSGCRRSSMFDDKDELTEVIASRPVTRTFDDNDPTQLENRHIHDISSNTAPAPPEFASTSVSPQSGKSSRHAAIPRWLTELYTISYLIFFSFIGTLARLGVQWLTFYPGAPVVTPVIWANCIGSAALGFLSEDQALFHQTTHVLDGNMTERANGGVELSKIEVTKRKKVIPLYIGLATGFCGSFTSFSSFARDAFLALANSLPTPVDHPYDTSVSVSTSTTVRRHDGYSFLALWSEVLQTLALSLGGLILGAQIAIFLAPYTPVISSSFTRKVLDRSMFVLSFGCWLATILLAIFPPHQTWRGEVLFALIFSPLGCLLRFYVSLKLNGIAPSFPLGTFAVNMLGTAILGMCYDIQHVRVGIMGQTGGGRIGCQVLEGIQDGFCGCLTTVSTWVAEINGLRRKHGWIYALGTLTGAICLLVVIMGSVKWSVGFATPICNTGYVDKIPG